MNENLIKYFSNPRSFTIKRWLVELLKGNYVPHDALIDRVSLGLSNQQDLEDFGKLLTAVYQQGYFKAFNDYQKQLEKLGINIKIVEEPST
jgi:hypothetical protein